MSTQRPVLRSYHQLILFNKQRMLTNYINLGIFCQLIVGLEHKEQRKSISERMT